jgi:hypothetical protein
VAWWAWSSDRPPSPLKSVESDFSDLFDDD